MSLDVGFAAQTPSLPGAGSAAGGLGETFTPDLSTGTGTFTVPLDLPNGPNDIGPKLVLRYDTASPNGPFGRGWVLALPRLLRSTMRGRPRYDDDDTLVLEGSGPLLRTPDGGWRPEVDTGDWRVALVAASAADGFVVTDRAGMRYELGTTADSRVDGPGGVPWSWLVHRIEDNLGHAATFVWRAAGTQRYLETIDYGVYRVAFAYEPRPDRLRWTRGGFVCATDERCAAVELRIPDAARPLVRRWDLRYVQSEPSGASLLSTVSMTGVAADGTELSTPPLMMRYTTPAAPRLVRITARDEGGAPPALDTRGRVELIDWNGDGVADVLEIGTGGDARVWTNLGGAWDRPRTVANLPQLAGDTARAGLVDLDGNGRADAVRVDVPAPGYQPRGRDGFGRPVQWARAPSVPLGAPTTRLGDLDGDGIVDLVWSTGRALLLAHQEAHGGWEERPQVVPARADGPPTDLGDPHVFLADMTGDGTPDIVRVDGGAVSYWPYLGYGTFGDAVRMGAPPALPFDVDIERVFVVDLDGDGCADILYLDDHAGAARWWPNCAGDHFGPMRIVPHLPVAAMRVVRVADVLATGVPTLCWSGGARPSGQTSWYALDLIGPQRTGLLASIDNGVGRHTEVGYTTSAAERRRDRDLGRDWRATVPMVLPLVQSTTSVDAVTGRTDVSRFQYHDGRYDDVRREFCGFGEVIQTDPGDAHVPTLVTTRRFHVGLRKDGSEPANARERADARAIRGRLSDQIRSDEDGAPFDRVEHTWETTAGDMEGVVVPRLRRITTSRYDGAAVDAPASRIETETVAWDADGNVLEQVERSFAGSTTASVRTLRTRIDYAVDPTGRYRQRTARVRQDDGAGGVVADTLTFYDERPLGEVGPTGLVTARHGLALTDELAAVVYGAPAPDFAALGYERRDEAPGWWIPLGTYARTVDADGVVRGLLTGLRGAPSRLALDPTGCYPAEVTDAVGNRVTAEFDPRPYQPVRLTAPSGAQSRAEFDALARLSKTIESGDTDAEPTVAYEYRTDVLPVELAVRRRGAAGGTPIEEREFLDGDGRLLERRGRDDTGEVVDSSVAYGPRGLPVRQFLPHRPASPQYAPTDTATPHAELFYDAAGRPVRSVRPDGGVHALAYGPGRIEETDPTGRTTVRHLDATGRVVRTEEPVGDRVLVAAFTFDLKGNVVEHVDPGGNTTRFAYDLMSRLLRSVRPGATQTVVVDPAGNPVETRAGDHVLVRTFDIANRIVAVRHAANASPVLQCTYHDNGAPAPADAGAHTEGGRLIRVDDESGTTVLDYDARGRIATKRMRVRDGIGVAANELVLGMTYRPDGLVETITYPTEGGVAPVVATYEYDRRARLRRLSGVIDAVEYDLAGRRTQTRHANGTVQREAHDPLTGWRASAMVEHGATTLRDVEYRHDLLGNLVAIDSPDPALAWAYRYDVRSQLVEASRAAPGVGPLTYSYDDAGNLTASSALGAYRYGEAGAASTLLTTAGTDTFTYDDRGHVQTAPWGTHTVDAEGRLRRIDLTGGERQEFTYGHNGVLARRRDVDGSDHVTRDVASPDRLVWIEDGALVLQFTDGGRIVARHDVNATQRTWLHTDHVGSLVLVTDASGDVVLAQQFDPYGRVLARNGATVAPQGFATGEAAGPDLVLLGARWYCPSIGRFLAPDPLVANAYDAIAWNAYAYARNNPASYIDPTGRDFWKVFGMVLAAVAIIALIVVVSVFTFGIGTPGAIAIGGVTWGAIFTATMVGVVAGGVIGGIAAARAGGDASDILLGVLVGGAVGGWAAFGAAFAGTAVAGAFGLQGVAGGAVAGGVSGAINGAAMGFASGFAGGKNNGFTDVMEKVLVGAIVGAAIGAALGALSGVTAPKESVRDSIEKEFRPQTPAGGAEGAPGSGGPGAGPPPGPTTPVNNFGDAMGKVGTGLAGKTAGALFPHAAAATAGFTGSIITQTIAVDVLTAGPGSLFWDDLQDYLRTHNVDLGPFDFLKGKS